MRKKVLLFSTLSPYPFWAGSEKFWFDFVTDERVGSVFDFHLCLADSPATRKKAAIAEECGATASFYMHFNVDFPRRNIYRLSDRLRRKGFRTLPWYDKIAAERYDLVWFCVSTLSELLDLQYPIKLCRKTETPYWISLQHSFEDFFFTSDREIDAISDIARSAISFIFIAKRNRKTLERAIGGNLDNAFNSANALPGKKMKEAKRIAASAPVGFSDRARFFNLGRFSPESKGQHLLLEAFAGNEWKERDWSLSFIGVSESGRSFFERLIAYFELDAGKVDFVPFTEDVFSEIAKHDVLLMPSLAEGTPYAMIESMACGRPAMGTPVGGIPELIVDAESGWLARTTDVSDIAAALDRLWNERSLWHAFGEKAQASIEANNNEENTVRDLLAKMVEDTSA